nr:Folylpolyglutamate synthase [Chlamydiota bacterium]
MLLTENYEEIIHKLFQRRPGKKPTDCSVMETILDCYDNPQNAYPIIHVAGTNGKGQVAAKIAFALQNAGLKVGLFISPHLFDYRERITINGQKISEEKILKYHFDFEEKLSRLPVEPNFFECTTTYAFRYFKEENIDVAIVEVGLGGKFDATNIVHPILSIITSVSFDHIEYLGE